MKLSIMDFFSKCDQIRSFLRIWSHLLRKSLTENFIFLYSVSCGFVHIYWRDPKWTTLVFVEWLCQAFQQNLILGPLNHVRCPQNWINEIKANIIEQINNYTHFVLSNCSFELEEIHLNNSYMKRTESHWWYVS